MKQHTDCNGIDNNSGDYLRYCHKNQKSNAVDDYKCLGETKFWYFMLSSIVPFCASLLLIFMCRLFCREATEKSTENEESLVERNQKDDEEWELVEFNEAEEEKDISWITEPSEWAAIFISDETITGQSLQILILIQSLFCFGLYCYDAYVQKFEMETCIPWQNNPNQQMDLSFNMFFLPNFLFGFIAAKDKLWFLLEVNTIVDFCTIPPAFVGIFLERNSLGLRFMRVLRLLTIPTILKFTGALETPSSFRHTQLVTTFVSVCIVIAGGVHVVVHALPL